MFLTELRRVDRISSAAVVHETSRVIASAGERFHRWLTVVQTALREIWRATCDGLALGVTTADAHVVRTGHINTAALSQGSLAVIRSLAFSSLKRRITVQRPNLKVGSTLSISFRQILILRG